MARTPKFNKRKKGFSGTQFWASKVSVEHGRNEPGEATGSAVPAGEVGGPVPGFLPGEPIGSVPCEVAEGPVPDSVPGEAVVSALGEAAENLVLNSQPGPTIDKITASCELIKEIQSEDIALDLMDIKVLDLFIKNNTRCTRCDRLESLNVKSKPLAGLAREFVLQCDGCGVLAKFTNSKSEKRQFKGKSTNLHSINFALVNAARIAGFGREATKRFLSFLNLRSPPDNWIFYQTTLRDVFKERAEKSMQEAAAEVKAHADEHGLEYAASFDGSWMKRGLVSLIGFVSAIGVYNNKIIGIDIRCKYCPSCKGKATDYSPCKLGADCSINHRGSSGAMEPVGAVNIIRVLAQNGLKITQYLSDGDSKAFAAVSREFDWNITKFECVNHVAKRMGARLLKRKKTEKGLGGRRGGLTEAACKKIQSYYHWVITSSDGDVQRMQKRIDALYRHISSSDTMPDHDDCEEKFCKYAEEKKRKAEQEDQLNAGALVQRLRRVGKKKMKPKQEPPMEYRHQNHFHIPADQMERVKDIFVDLAKPELLEKTTHGKTQNANECFNSTVWNLLPKNGFANRPLVELAVYMAICQFNEGRRPVLEVFSGNGVPISNNLKQYCRSADQLRVAKRKRESAGCSRKIKKLKGVAAKVETAKDYASGSF